MPRVAEFSGLKINMYAADHNPPHVHVIYADDEALLAIDDGRIIAGDMPAKQLRAARAWLDANRVAVVARWAALNPAR
jgi:hypothetical protein